jgi:ABC-2 type transport system ATP-binding protein
MAALLEASGLCKSYDGAVALDRLDLAVEPGEVFCLLGANGAGKTTTIHLFLGFTAPSAGRARIKGLDVRERPLETKRWIAYVPEQVQLYRNLSGLENLAYFTALADGAEPDREALLGVLAEVGLDGPTASKRVATYSKGMRQKVGIAVALAKHAEALLLDEPTSGLDPAAANEFSALLRRLSADGVAVLMATHDLFRAKEVGHRVGIMKRGRLVDTLATAGLDHAGLERIYLDHMHG